ncbi:MAG TPA: thymidine phosphorylase [Verrucomicrobiae bacterium]|jgi:pyrimidine-nucleoside phosphorylase|nr:thymidine phosphorylase [Verrucomicrobiae bacterium]
MRPVDLIRKKRDGGEHTSVEIGALIEAYTRGDVPDYQMSAWMMAALLRGLSAAETAALTEAMLRSGHVLDLNSLPGVKVDKHSTGGVGDKTSLILAPVVAAGRLLVPMISGRGLGHTGGTLDKLEAIPDFNVNLSVDEFRRVLKQCGCSLIGQTAEIAPADKKMYALRDVTGTVESPSLICASIMSKKLAEGIEALVLDVKTGSGAFMKRQDDAERLATMMVETGERLGKRTVALITNMDQPLGRMVGNSLEVLECVEILRGERRAMSEDLRELSVELSAWMFFLGRRASSVGEGRLLAEEIITSGKALAKFRDLIRLQGGDTGVLDQTSRLASAKFKSEFKAATTGFIASVQCEQVGLASLMLGGGRNKKDDVIDPLVGLELHKKIGDAVATGEGIATIHHNDAAKLSEAVRLLSDAYRIGPKPVTEKRVLVKKVIGS